MFFNGKYAHRTFAIPVFSKRHRESCKMPTLRSSKIEMTPPQPHSTLQSRSGRHWMSTYFIPRAHSNNQSTAYALIISTSKENANPDPRHNRPTEDPNPKETESEQGDDRVPSTGATGHAARSCGVYRRRRRRPPPPPQAQPRRRPPPRPGRPASGSPAAANSPAPCPIRPPRQQQQQPEPGAPSQERRHRETGERNPPLRATQTSPRDRRERQVGAAGTQSRLTSASRSFLQACSHTHSQLPRGSALFLPHPETLTPSEYPGKKKASVFVLFSSSLACFCGREWGLVLEAVAAMKLRGSFLRRLTLPHGPAHGQDWAA